MPIKEKRFSKYLDIAGSFIISIDRKYIITYINIRGAEILGYPVEYIIGKDYFDLCVRENLQELSRKRFDKLFEIPFEKSNNFEGRIFNSKGEERIINWTNNALRDENGNIIEIISSGNDITWRFQMLRKSLERERKYRTLIETTDTAYIIINKHGNLIEANGKFVNLTGANSFEDIRGKRVSGFIADYDQVSYSENLVYCLKTKKVNHFEIDMINNIGEIIPIQMSSKAIVKDKEVTIMTLCRDITERKKIEEQQKLHDQQLMQADKMASLGILVSGIAHEINNPNNFVMLNIPILKTMWNNIEPILDAHHQENGDFLVSKRLMYSQIKDTVPQLLQGIYDGSIRIKNIVRELKDYARLEKTTELQPLSINEVIKTAIMLTSNLIKRTTTDFRIDLDEEIPKINGNFQKIEQVIINLLQNSCQAISDRSQRITITSKYEKRRELVIIEIKDEGEGMSSDTIGKIFDPFFTTKRAKGGTGLGLAVSSKIIRHHKGEIKYQSSLNEGTCVTITFPSLKREK